MISCSYSSFDGSGTEYESTVEYVFRLGGAILIDTSPGRNGVNTSFRVPWTTLLKGNSLFCVNASFVGSGNCIVNSYVSPNFICFAGCNRLLK